MKGGGGGISLCGLVSWVSVVVRMGDGRRGGGRGHGGKEERYGGKEEKDTGTAEMEIGGKIKIWERLS